MEDQDKKLPEKKEEQDDKEETPPEPEKKEEKKKTYTSTLSFGAALDKMVKKKKLEDKEKDCDKEE